MCSNYVPVTRKDRLLQFFGAERARNDPAADVWPLGLAPFIRLAQDGSGNVICDDGVFGLLPQFQVEMAAGRKTYNARSETVHIKPSYRDAWKRGQRCIIPAEVIYEPCWEAGKAVRWAIRQPSDIPLGIAGIWTAWRNLEGREFLTFAMLTVNANGHPIFERMHRPEDEKRMVLILNHADYGAWLKSSVSDAPQFFRQWLGELVAEPRPLPPRAPKTTSGKVVKPTAPDLF